MNPIFPLFYIHGDYWTFSKHPRGYFWSGNYTYKYTWHIYPCKLHSSHSNAVRDTYLWDVKLPLGEHFAMFRRDHDPSIRWELVAQPHTITSQITCISDITKHTNIINTGALQGCDALSQCNVVTHNLTWMPTLTAPVTYVPAVKLVILTLRFCQPIP